MKVPLLPSRKADREEIKDFLRGDSLDKKGLFKKANRNLNSFTADVMGNWETLMTMIGGTDMRDKRSFMLNEAQATVGTQESLNKLLSKVKGIYGEKSKLSTLNKIHGLADKEYSLNRPNEFGKPGEGDPFKLSKLDLMDIYNAIANDRIADDYYMSYGDISIAEDGSRDVDAQYKSGMDKIEGLIQKLSPEDKQFAEAMKEIIGSYRKPMNDVHINLYNRDMQDVGEYWPSTAQRQKDIDPMAQMSQDYRYASSLQSRMEHRTPVPSDAFNKFMKHIEEAEWMINMALPFNKAHDIFKDNQVRALIESARGRKFLNLIDDSLINTTLNSPNKIQSSELTSLLNPVLNNWVTAKIGGTPSVPVKQLLSSVNYAENMPSLKWATGFVKGLVSPRDTWKEMMQIPYLKTRLGNGYSEAVQRALNGDENVHKSKVTNFHQAFKNLMTIGTRYGDITAIIFGGKPYLDYLIKDKGMSEKEAVDKFLQDTLRSQQAPFASTLSKLQNSKNPFLRAFFTFSNTPSQYMRKMFEANQNLRVQKQQLKKGKITQQEFNKVMTQTAKAHTIYGLINTITFTMAGAMVNSLMKGSDPDDELLKDMLAQLSATYTGGLPIIKDVLATATRQGLGMRVYDDVNPYVEAMDGLITEGIKLSRGETKDQGKSIEKIGRNVSDMLGIPYDNFKKDIKAIPPFREATFRATRVKEADNKLNSLKKSDDVQLSDAATELKSQYSKAKYASTKLKKEGKMFKAERIESLIDDSKVNMWESDYSVGEMMMEAKMFSKIVESNK